MYLSICIHITLIIYYLSTILDIYLLNIPFIEGILFTFTTIVQFILVFTSIFMYYFFIHFFLFITIYFIFSLSSTTFQTENKKLYFALFALLLFYIINIYQINNLLYFIALPVIKIFYFDLDLSIHLFYSTLSYIKHILSILYSISLMYLVCIYIFIYFFNINYIQVYLYIILFISLSSSSISILCLLLLPILYSSILNTTLFLNIRMFKNRVWYYSMSRLI